MARGVISGVAAGTVVAAVGLATLSLLLPVPQAPESGVAVAPGLAPGLAGSDPSGAEPPVSAPPASAPPAATASPGLPMPEGSPAAAISLPEGSEFARSANDAAPAAPQSPPALGEGAAAPAAPATGAGAEAAAPMTIAGTEPAARPETGATTPLAPAAPETARAALDGAPQAEPAMPVPPPGEAKAPDLPNPETAAPATADPAAQPSAAQVPGAQAPAAQAPGAEITLMPDGALVPPSPKLPRVFAPAGDAGFADAGGAKVNRLPQIGAAPDAAETEPAPAPAPESGPQSGPESAPVPPGFLRPPGAVAARTAPAPKVNRPAAPAPEAESAEGGPEGASPEEGALSRFAAPFVATPGKPLFTVVLIDVGAAAGGLDPATIAALGPSVTVALDPGRADAAAAAALYRSAGMEVAILADALPKGATPQDLEVAFDAWHRVLPEAVALVEPEQPVIQPDARLVSQAVKALAGAGMAYVTQGTGIPRAGQIAQSAQLPHARVWRVLDARREKAAVVQRVLGRAAFESGREGGVVVMLSSWPESVAGLGAWSADAAAQVSLAPLSAQVLAAQVLAPPAN